MFSCKGYRPPHLPPYITSWEHKLAISDYSFLDHKYIFHVNSYRLRRRGDFSLEKPKDCIRILVLGDSFVEGKGVNDDETFCFLLEKYFNTFKKNDIRYEVLNSGVDSYAPIVEYLYLKTDGIKFSPDLVILFLDMSDIEQTPAYLKLAIRDEKGEIVKIPPPIRSLSYKTASFIGNRFYYLSRVYFVSHIMKKFYHDDLDTIRELSNKHILDFTLSADQSPWGNEWQEIYNDIESVNNFCKERGVFFALVIYPWGFQVNNIESDGARQRFGIPRNYTASPDLSYMVEKIFEIKHIPVLNLFPTFRGYKGTKLLYYKNDVHWTREGHVLVAQCLFDFINKKFINSITNF